MITFSNGHSFQFMTASGALAFDGRGWPWEWPLRWIGLIDPTCFTLVTKTLTRRPRRGNLRWTHPWSVVKGISPSPASLTPDKVGEGIVNAIGLTNRGIEWWIKKVAPRIPPHYKTVVSIEAEEEKETVEMIQMLSAQKKIVGIELNLSCPNTPTADQRSIEKILSICRKASEYSPFPLIAKLSYTHPYSFIAKSLEGSNVQAISINSIPWQALFPDRPSPLARFGGGGVSGKIIQPTTWKMVEEIAKTSKIPVIGPSVWDYEDIQKIFDRGAKAVSFGSIFVSYPWRPTSFVKRWAKEHP